MSWKSAGILLSGAPSSSSSPTASASTSLLRSESQSLAQRHRPNQHHGTAYSRERQVAVYQRDISQPERRSEWDVLREHHRFLRPEEGPGGAGSEAKEGTWEDRLARRYEEKLFKEFALIDLKHYKSRRYALRWRTAPEVVNGIGEETCASLRCKHHQPPTDLSDGRMAFDLPPGDEHDDEPGYRQPRRKRRSAPQLRAFELPFAYVEQGQRKEAMVKVRLCRRCERKLRWKPEEESRAGEEEETESGVESNGERSYAPRRRRDQDDERIRRKDRDRSRSRSPRQEDRHHQRRNKEGQRHDSRNTDEQRHSDSDGDSRNVDGHR